MYATTTAIVHVDGAQRRIIGGSHWPANDPVVAQHPTLFSQSPLYGMQWSVEPDGWNDPPVERPVEQATAAPGEKRNTRR